MNNLGQQNEKVPWDIWVMPKMVSPHKKVVTFWKEYCIFHTPGQSFRLGGQSADSLGLYAPNCDQNVEDDSPRDMSRTVLINSYFPDNIW